ncbi:UNVERIFIED_CONTAM: hypothetical protein FKN15_014662 [Acipenser sinensis]
MNRNTFPALDKLRETLDNEKNHKQSPPPPGKKYNVNPVPMKDQGKLGAPVQALCQGLPAYWAQEQIGEAQTGSQGGPKMALPLLVFVPTLF